MSDKGNLECLDWALAYAALGWFVIPIGIRDDGEWKRAKIAWAYRRNIRPSTDEIRRWWSKWPDARVGIVTGQISDLVVVDIDPRHGGSTEGIILPPTLVAKTGGGGWHYYYSHPGIYIPSVTNTPRGGIDIRADGGIVIAPPSIHSSNKHYEWIERPDLSMIAPCPEWIIQINQEGSKKGQAPTSKFGKKPIKNVLQRANNTPIDLVIHRVAKMVGIDITYIHNSNGTRQIVENNEITSGYISSRGNFCASASGKARSGGPISVTKYYLNEVGRQTNTCSQIIKIINSLHL